MKIVLWIGNEPHQKALANKIHARYRLSGIVTENRLPDKHWTVAKVMDKIFFPVIAKAWSGLQEQYNTRYPTYPSVARLNVPNINDEAAYTFSKELNPDLIIVSGISLVKEKMLSLHPSIGILNLHNGLLPYIKGSPNSTNWCLATEQYHLIGNTILWMNTDAILTSAFTVFKGTEDLSELHLTVTEHAHNLYLKAITYLATGGRQSIAQHSIAPGTTYSNKEWGLKQKIKLVLNLPKWRTYLSRMNYIKDRKDIKMVGLPGIDGGCIMC